MAIISKHLLFTVLFLVAGFLLAFSEPPDNRRPPRPPSRPPSPPPPRRSPPPPLRSPPPPRHRSPSPPRPSPPPSPSPPPPPRPSPPPPPLKPLPGFDYFMLALQWPNTFCYTTNTSSICKTTKPIRQYFTIHGLWPQKNTGRSLNCDTNKRMTDDILEKFETDLLQYWPRLFSPDNFGYSKKFWKEQWDRHGTCSSDKYSQEDYLKTTIALGKMYGPIILDKMKKKGIKPSRTTLYSKKHTLEAIKEATKTVAHLLCSTDSGKNQLLEIRLCFEADGKTLQDCKSNNKDDDCKKDFIFPSSVTETHSRFPSFMSSILDVLEAVGI